MSGLEISSLITNIITLADTLYVVYICIKDPRNLPRAFQEVGGRIPLLTQILQAAKPQVDGLESGKDADAVGIILASCEKKIEQLLLIFERIRDKSTETSAKAVYKKLALQLGKGKAARIETLMNDILKDMQILVAHSAFKSTLQVHSKAVGEAREELEKVERDNPSLPDALFEGQPSSTYTNYGGDQINNARTGKVVGNQFNAQGDQSFGVEVDLNAQNIGTVQIISDHGDRLLQEGRHKTQGRDTGKMLKRLEFRDLKERKDINPDRIEGTCEWFVTHRLFQDWRESQSSRLLWVSADPGCGKSVLAKYLIDTVLPTTEYRTACYFFFKDSPDQKAMSTALCSILHQLFRQKVILLSDAVLDQYEHDDRFTNSLGELWDILVKCAEDDEAGEIICILDAVDECEGRGWCQIAQSLCKFYGTEMGHSCRLKFLITSRPYIRIRHDFQPLDIPNQPTIHLAGDGEAEMKMICREIDIFIEVRTETIRRKLRLEQDEVCFLREKLTCNPNRTYLWVHLTLDLIQSWVVIDKEGIRNATTRLPRGINEAYDQLLIRCPDPQAAKKILHVIVAVERPLTVDEMAVALALRNHQSYDGLELEPEERLRDQIRHLCGLLVRIEDSRLYLLHQTVKEFLVKEDPEDTSSINSSNGNTWKHLLQSRHLENGSSGGNGSGDNKQSGNSGFVWKHSLQSRDSHRILANICIQHLLFTEFEAQSFEADNSAILQQYVDNHTLLDYSANYWVAHFRKAYIEDESVIESALELCNANSKRCRTWLRVYWETTQTTFPANFTSIMIGSYFGLGSVAKLLLTKGGINLRSTDDTYGRTALSWAAGNGFTTVCELLIRGSENRLKGAIKKISQRGTQVNSVDKYCRTPLSYAIWSGNKAVVELLIKKGAKVDLEDRSGGTPLSYAICNSNQDITNLLLEGEGTEIDLEEIRKTWLLSAAKSGDVAVVKLLFETGEVDLDVEDSTGRTPLSWATENSHDGVIGLLRQPLYQRMARKICAFEDFRLYQQILATIVAAYRPLTLTELASFIWPPEENSSHQAALKQMITMCPSFLDIHHGKIRFVHISAREYLSAHSQLKLPPSGLRHIHEIIYSRSLTAICTTLRPNIYNLEHLGVLVDDIQTPDPDPLDAVQYSCIHWIDHLCDMYASSGGAEQPKDPGDDAQIHQFFCKFSLFWIEALSLLRGTPKGFRSIRRLGTVVKERYPQSRLAARLHDLYEFTLQFEESVENAPLQVYITAFIFSPIDCLTRKLAEEGIPPGWIVRRPQRMELKIRRDDRMVVSKSGRYTASISFKNTIVEIYDMDTGTCFQTLSGNSEDSFSLVLFSNNDRYILSTSRRTRSIKIWDIASGTRIQKLVGNTEGIYLWRMRFSENDRYLVLPSYGPGFGLSPDIKLWDIARGTWTQTVIQCNGVVWLVASSNDERYIASVSEATPRSIDIWDIARDTWTQTLSGHKDHVHSIAFSNDDRFIISGSDDKTINIWDIATGVCSRTIPVGFRTSSILYNVPGGFIDTDFGRISLNIEPHPMETPAIQIPTHTHRQTSINPEDPAPVQCQPRCEVYGQESYRGYGLTVDREWVTWNGHGILWIPPKYRSSSEAVLHFPLPSPSPSPLPTLGLTTCRLSFGAAGGFFFMEFSGPPFVKL